MDCVAANASAPEGRQIIARRANAWKRSPTNQMSPNGATLVSTVSPRWGSNLIASVSRGCAALHPWLLSVAPPGLMQSLRHQTAHLRHNSFAPLHPHSPAARFRCGTSWTTFQARPTFSSATIA